MPHFIFSLGSVACGFMLPERFFFLSMSVSFINIWVQPCILSLLLLQGGRNEYMFLLDCKNYKVGRDDQKKMDKLKTGRHFSFLTIVDINTSCLPLWWLCILLLTLVRWIQNRLSCVSYELIRVNYVVIVLADIIKIMCAQAALDTHYESSPYGEGWD